MSNLNKEEGLKELQECKLGNKKNKDKPKDKLKDKHNFNNKLKTHKLLRKKRNNH